VRAGKLDRIITLRSRVQTKNDFGEMEESFKDLGKVWAEKRDLRGNERFVAQQTVGRVDTVFRIRHRTDISSLSELICDEENYEIQGILELGRREGLELQARRRSE